MEVQAYLLLLQDPPDIIIMTGLLLFIKIQIISKGLFPKILCWLHLKNDCRVYQCIAVYSIQNCLLHENYNIVINTNIRLFIFAV